NTHCSARHHHQRLLHTALCDSSRRCARTFRKPPALLCWLRNQRDRRCRLCLLSGVHDHWNSTGPFSLWHFPAHFGHRALFHNCLPARFGRHQPLCPGTFLSTICECTSFSSVFDFRMVSRTLSCDSDPLCLFFYSV